MEATVVTIWAFGLDYIANCIRLFSEMRLFRHQKESFLIQIVVFKRKKPWVLANQSGLNSFPIRYHIEFTTCHFIPIFIDYVFHAEAKKGFQSTFSWTIAHKSTRSWAITFDDMYLMCVPYISVFVSETCLPPFEKKKTATTLDPKLAVLPIIICWHIKSL